MGCMAESYSVSQFATVSRTDVIVLPSPVAGVVIAGAIGASGKITTVVSGGLVGIFVSIPRGLPPICLTISLVAG